MLRKKIFKFVAHLSLILFLSGILSLAVHGVPMNNLPQQVTQKDGTLITIRGFGDEFFSWIEDEYGNVIAYDSENANWHYATVQDGRIVPSGTVINPIFTPFSGTITREDLQPLIDNVDRSLFNKIVTIHDKSDEGINSAIRSLNEPINNNPLMLVLLVEYNDIQLTQNMNYWHNHHFGETGSTVNNYFTEVSNGTFAFQSAVFKNISGGGEITTGLPDSVSEIEFASNGVVRIKLNKVHPTYYDSNGIVEDIGTAFTAIYQYIDFTGIDNLWHNCIKRDDFHVSVIMAGWENSTGLNSNKSQRVHAYANTVRTGVAGGDSLPVSIDTRDGSLLSFNVQGELYSGETGTNAIPLGIGTTVHELGHSLGLPDLYDITSSSDGIGPFCVMSSGSWGAKEGELAGTTPVHLSAWSKIELGFATPETVCSDEYTEVNLADISRNDYSVLKLTSDIADDSRQYFLTENRSLVGYDAGFWIFGIRPEKNNHGGIIVYHIDESRRSDKNEDNANEYRRLVNVIAADNNNLLNDLQYTNGYGENNFFFSNEPYGEEFNIFDTFSANTLPNSNFYGSDNSRNILSGIQFKVKSERGEVMLLEVGNAADSEPSDITDILESLFEEVDNNYKIISDDSADYITGIEIGDVASLGLSDGAAVYKSDSDIPLYPEDKIGTGMIIKKGEKEILIVIKGDIDGSGSHDINDAKTFLESLVGNVPLTGASEKAAEDFISESDIKKLRLFLIFLTLSEA